MGTASDDAVGAAGTVGGVSVLAVRGDRGAVIGENEIPLRDGERVVVCAGA
jgi:hypothetical protein